MLKICLIGLGNWGKNHARVLSELKNQDLIDELYFFDENNTRSQAYAKLYDGSATSDPFSLDLDAVDIVVPANSHYEVAKPFLESGISTFIEKPFTDNVEDAINLIDITKRPSENIMVGHIFRFHSGVSLAKDLIAKGSIGEIKKVDIRRLALGTPRTDNGVIYSLAIHDLDLFCYFADDMDPVEISCITSTIIGPTEDHAFLKINHKKSIGIAEESWMSPSTGKVRTCSIQGTQGEIFFDFSKPSEVQINSKYINQKIIDNGSFTHSVPFVEPLGAEITHFVKSLRDKTPFKVGPDVGLRAVKLCDKALQSAKLKKSLPFNE